MDILHLSREAQYRDPFGAVPCGTMVRLRIKIIFTEDEFKNQPLRKVSLFYLYGLYQFHGSNIQMEKMENQGDFPYEEWYEATLPMPEERGLLFYWFHIEKEWEDLWAVPEYTASRLKLQQQSPEIHMDNPIHAFQITVYENDYQAPEWLIGAVMYQIFPDRFKRSSDKSYQERRLLLKDKNYDERIYHENWNEDVDYHGKPETGYLACDFYGGDLQGIIEEIDHIADLGITVIYLNPIFEARSNHRYDTGDYRKIDPLLGKEEDLTRLIKAAAAKDSKIILDGVFSHTGADSLYFNKYQRYQGIGAYGNVTEKDDEFSPYESWYSFSKNKDGKHYSAWWGFPELPSVNKYDLPYNQYINGKNGAIRKWLDLGIAGFRLDVSDELPDAFLRNIHRCIKGKGEDRAIIGEVWEDASNKRSYGNYRDFILGKTHDGVMGYPFHNTLLAWLSGYDTAYVMEERLLLQQENYPVFAQYCNMNLISSHDIPRAITFMVGEVDPGSREDQASTFLTATQIEKGKKLLRLAWYFQNAYPGVAALYYGDETAMQGYRDPFNRRTYPWDFQDVELLEQFKEIGKLRKTYPLLKSAYVKVKAFIDDVFLVERFLVDGCDVFGKKIEGPQKIQFLFNRSENKRAVILEDEEHLIAEMDVVYWCSE